MEYIIYAAIAVVIVALLVISSRFQRTPPYKHRPILTKTEYAFWKVLQPRAARRNILVCPKVRMEDFLEVKTKDNRKRQSWRGRIKSRHIDFILCDSDLNMLAGVELDDNSHKYNKATIEGDLFKNSVFKAIGMPLFRIIVKDGNYPEQIDRMFRTLGK